MHLETSYKGDLGCIERERSFNLRIWCRIGAAGAVLAATVAVSGQVASKTRPTVSVLQEHYDAAQTLQGNGDLTHAASEYKLFLAEALHRVANGRAKVGEYPEAVPLFDEALALAPNDTALAMDYTSAALDARELLKAQHLAQALVDATAKGTGNSEVASMHRLLGQALLGMDDSKEAKDQFTIAVAMNRTPENEYALAQAYLALLDKADAAKIFGTLQAKLGDTANVHMQIGLAYWNADFPEEAIPEFKKTLARDGEFPDAHYSLGASYLKRSGDTAFPAAEAEFRKELSFHPDDFYSYYELGYLAMNEHQLTEADRDLTRAAELNPYSDDTFILLGDLDSQLGKSAEEETALRRAIQLCVDPSRNHYQIRGAHYELGLLLIQNGKSDEGKKEMLIAQDLLLQNRKLDAANLAGKAVLRFPARKTDVITDPAGVARVKQFEQQVGPAIADSLNNLGSISAQREDYLSASAFFKLAAEWNPKMDGLDYNWGRAAFGARDYHQAAICLSRYMKAHPGDDRPRVPLGMSQFQLSDYSDAINTLAPLGAQLDTVPLLAYAYADSLVKTGDVDQGVERLKRLEAADPSLDVVPVALGEAFESQKQYLEAEVQFRAALRIEPENKNAKYDLALTLICLGQKSESQSLLKDLARTERNKPTIYYQLGKLQLDGGYTDDAITSLETAAKLAPGDDAIRTELTEAHHRKSLEGK